MKHLTLLKNWSDEAFNASLPRFIASSLHRWQHYINPCRNCHKTGQNFPTHMYRQRRWCFSAFAMEITEITNFFGNCQWNSLLHRFFALILFFVKALRQWSRIREAMKRWNVNYGRKLKQWSDEAFNAGKEIEAMKRLTLHRIASSLHRFIASTAQLWYPLPIGGHR